MICYIIQQTWTSAVPTKGCAFSNRRALLERGFEEAFRLSLHDLDICYGPHGKPQVADRKDVFFNITHTYNRYPNISGTSGEISDSHVLQSRDYYMAGAFSHCEVGIDCEYPRPVTEQLCRRVLSSEEKALLQASKNPEMLFIRLWTLKESYLKFTGEGLSHDPASLSFSRDSNDRFILTHHPEVHFLQFDLNDGLILSLCTTNEVDVRFITL